jgi:thioredoxin-like negative regulator of GroEL
MEILPKLQLLRLEDYPSANIESAQDIDQRLQQVFDCLVVQHECVLLYIGAIWCSPCKALRPLLVNRLKQYSQLPSYEIELSEDVFYDQSRWLKSLPGVFLLKAKSGPDRAKARVVAQVNGLVDSLSLQALFDQATLADEPLPSQQSVLIDKQVCEDSSEAIKRILAQQGFSVAAKVYEGLPSEVKYEPQLQQVKSLIELVRRAHNHLQGDALADVNPVYQSFLRQDVISGLDVLLCVLKNDKTQNSRLKELRSLYVLGLNTIEDKAKAGYFRKAYQSVL